MISDDADKGNQAGEIFPRNPSKRKAAVTTAGSDGNVDGGRDGLSCPQLLLGARADVRSVGRSDDRKTQPEGVNAGRLPSGILVGVVV